MTDQQLEESNAQPTEMFICHDCAAENFTDADFCGRCGAPISGFATLDPLRQIYSAGWVYRRAISGRQQPIIFWGMWLIFGPTVILAAIALIGGGIEFGFMTPPGSGYTAVGSESGSHDTASGEAIQGEWDAGKLIGLVAGGFIILLYAVILAKVTGRYLRHRRVDLAAAASGDPDT